MFMWFCGAPNHPHPKSFALHLAGGPVSLTVAVSIDLGVRFDWCVLVR